MGCWGTFCVFDHARFVGQVLPALAMGELHPLVAEVIAVGQKLRRFHCEFWGLDLVLDHLRADCSSCALGRDFWVREGVLHTSARTDWTSAVWGYAELCELMEMMVTRHCVSHFANLGRTHHLALALRPSNVCGMDDLMQQLVTLLESRAAYFKHGDGGYNEGLNGWLDADETYLFGEGLRGLSPDLTRLTLSEGSALTDVLRLLQVTVDVAVQRRMGVLWGGDLNVLYSHAWPFLAQEVGPVALSL